MSLPGPICLIATVKNEGPWLLEWVAHNKVVGFDRQVIAYNDCDDHTDEILARLAALGMVTTFENLPPYTHSIQGDAYARARALDEVKTAEWVMALDGDEFLNIHIGTGHLHDLILNQKDPAEGIIVNWRVFGDSHHTMWEDKPVCETFTLAAAEDTHRAQPKTLFRNHADFEQFTPHGPWNGPDWPKARKHVVRTANGVWLRGDSFGMEKPIQYIRQSKISWKTAQINHYILKTRDVFDLKKSRGRAVATEGARHTRRLWNRMNLNQVEDTSISRYRLRREAILADLMADPELGKLHRAACDVLRGKLARDPVA